MRRDIIELAYIQSLYTQTEITLVHKASCCYILIKIKVFL